MFVFGLVLLGAAALQPDVADAVQPDDEFGYVIVDAISDWPTSKQPTYVAVESGSKLKPLLPLRQRIHQLPPGEYEWISLEYGAPTPSLTPDTIFLSSRHYHFEIKAGQILVFGRIEVRRRGRLENIVTDLELVKGACPEAEPLFKRYPVVMRADPDRGEFRISCDEL